PARVRWRLRVADQVDDLVRRVGRAAVVVDDVVDGADTAERHDDEIVEPHTGRVRYLEGAFGDDALVHVEEAVAADAPRLVAGDGVRHLVGREAAGRTVHPRRLVRRVVGEFVLEEVGTAAVA